MALARLTEGLQHLLRGRFRPQRRSFLLSADEFQLAAQCERMRVDRNGSVLSVLLIQLAPDKSSSDDFRALSRLLESRLRLTDTAGFLLDGRVGLLLPDTPESGAWKVAADICDTYAVGSNRPQCEVFVYPEPGGGDSGKESQNDSTPGVAVGPGTTGLGEAFFATPISRTKRLMDVLGASLGLIASAPIIAVAAVLIKLTSPGGAFFLQEREGAGGKRFLICKLRTMYVGADNSKHELRKYSQQDGPAFKMQDDPRTTRIGWLLRRTSLDELPQLWNVLKGDMSLVGPRPLPTSESLQCARWQRQRLQVTPGLTCIWQIRGRNVVPFDEWIRMDLRYIRRRSVWYDLSLILQTFPAVVASKGPR